MATIMEDAFEGAGALKTKKTQVKQISPAPNDVHVRIPTIRSIKETTAVAEKRQYIGDIGPHMAGLVARIRGIRVVSSEEQAIRSKELKDLEDEILEHLNSGEELLANAARQAYAMAMVSTLPSDKRVVMETIKGDGSSRLPGLLSLKILELVSGDTKDAVTVKIYGGAYKVGGSRDFATKLAENLSAGAAHAAKAAHEFYHGEVAALKTQTTISIAEMLARKSGCFFLDVSDVRDGNRFLSGGALLAESDGKTIKILQARGHFKRTMTEIAEAEIFVFVESLNRERFEGGGLSDEIFRLCWILHAVLRRGITEAQTKS